MDVLWLARHGQTPYSLGNLINGDIRRQVSLDDTGRSQAAEISRILADEPIDICFTSPFSRAVETAHIATAGRSVPIRLRPRLGEVRCGDRFEGKTLDEYVAWVEQEGMYVVPPGEGAESFADTLLRYHQELSWISGQSGRDALVVAHGSPVAFARRLATYAGGEPLFPLPEASPAVPYRIPASALADGLKRAWARMASVASQDDLGRLWALRRGYGSPAPEEDM